MVTMIAALPRLLLARLLGALMLLTVALQAGMPFAAPLERVHGSAFSAATHEVALTTDRRVQAVRPALAPEPRLPAIEPLSAPPPPLAAPIAPRPFSTGPPPREEIARRPAPRAPPFA